MCLLTWKRTSKFHTSETISTGSAKRCVGGCASSGGLVIFRPELGEKILAGETEAARILELGYVGLVRRYPSRWQEGNWAAWGEYHQGQAERHRAVLESLIARHEEEAAKLIDIEPKGAA
jgi:hypothetical protein